MEVGAEHCIKAYAKITAEKVSRDIEKLSKQIEQMESFIC